MTVFVSVAAYRDSELVPTVLDCLAKARRPGELRIVVCWQHLGDEDTSAIAADPRVRLLDVDARRSRGACWARAEIMREYAGEDWFLQVDSHTRFAADWDAQLIDMAGRTGVEKPILSCYPPAYDPATEFTGEGEPTELLVERHSDDGLPVFGQRAIADWATRTRPVPARFVAGGFLFAPGSFAREVPYDPNLYFHGEEITVSARAYTWGYDLFHPVRVLSWHFYVRQERPRHWTDHSGGSGAQNWPSLDRASRRRALTMLRYPSVGRLAMGPVRPAAAYERYAGLDFRRGTATPEWTADR
ncbi:GlcNAc-transferase family protein [Rhizomonospora bruguierae]|uniref:GlcNAc-transferase family protein n=1 Tax=Rhizomonospora bruguierae TaxID=1581705 RepID=UPI001BCCC14E|nr:GlcNAc-transferase family protein [Micromonospora sp. NBRC 107566]